MSEDRPHVGEDDLVAYIDGRLAEDRRAAVERLLAEDPDIRARLAADRAARDSLRQRLGPIAEQPIPARLRVDAILARRRQNLHHRLRIAAACIALVSTGAAAGWEAHDSLPRPSAAPPGENATTATEAIAAHRVFVVETAHPVEVAAAQQAHLVQWLSRRVGHPLTTPDLTAQGYTLMGGRVLPAGTGAAAQFMYETAAGRRLTVYVRASDGGDTRFRFVAAPGVAAFSWIDQGLGFALVGALDRAQLLDLADTVYQQVDPQHRPAPAAL